MHYLIQNFRYIKHWPEKLPVYFSFGLISLSSVAVPVVGYFTFHNQLNGVWLNFYLTALAMFILAVLIFVALRYKEIEKAFVLTVSFILVVMLTGLPILGHINVNPEYNSINKLSATDHQINVYGFVDLAPEIIWHYGKPIPVIDPAEQDLPNHKIYNVLVNPAYEDDFKRVMLNVGTIQFIETFNLNYFAVAGKKSRSDRLVCSQYLVKVDGKQLMSKKEK